jgi:chemotaxis signal transduction protein
VSVATSDLDRRAAELRAAFDDAFGRPAALTEGATEDLLPIRVAADLYALRIPELTGLLVKRRVVPLPSRRAELVGLCGVRGELVPVYSLSLLLGYGAEPAAKWLAVCGTPRPVALAFDEIDGFLRLPRTGLYALDRADASRPHLAEAVRIGATTRRVIDTRSILKWLDLEAGSSGAT